MKEIMEFPFVNREFSAFQWREIPRFLVVSNILSHNIFLILNRLYSGFWINVAFVCIY